MPNPNHPVKPGDDLVSQWSSKPGSNAKSLAEDAASWGSDQELNAVIQFLKLKRLNAYAHELQEVRRPSDIPINERALNIINTNPTNAYTAEQIDLIRRALSESITPPPRNPNVIIP